MTRGRNPASEEIGSAKGKKRRNRALKLHAGIEPKRCECRAIMTQMASEKGGRQQERARRHGDDEKGKGQVTNSAWGERRWQ